MSGPRMDGRVAVITGVGRSGQAGQAVAAAFGSLGAHCVLLDRNAGEVAERAAELRAAGASAEAHACDLTDASALGAVASSLATRASGEVHSLVCLAGGYAGAAVADTAPEAWQRMFDVNVTTAFLTTRAFLPLVRRGRGAIVYFASAAALPGNRVSGHVAYAAAKTGVLTLMRAVAAEEHKHGVRANALAPTAIRTASNLATLDPGTSYVERETVADWVTLLCSEAAGSVNGQVIKLG
ncbi:MAG: SDR family NAD(P)-dependent oxidoreductase [Gemmatimonadaceae bacterium]|nr:SDR family NAD(P)-dependent oxidoreductase [Gemmatimonadaceae bacterium]